ncbi:MAG TPA: ATP-binding protein [Spirochaetota bacterium]|nr:ATP-binding protein [Spirochaetota bacterium]
MKRKPFFWSIFPAFVFITFISGLLIIVFSVKTFKQIYSDSIYDKIIGDAAFMKAYIARTDSAEVAGLDSLVKDFSGNSITRITVTDEKGLVLADSKEAASVMENHLSRPEFQAAVSGETGKSVRFSSTIKKELMYVTLPMFTSNGKKYIVRTAYPLISLSDTIFYFEKKVFWIVLFVIVLLAGVSMYLSKRLSAPLIQLKDKAKKIAEGNFKQDIEEYSHYETNQLSESMSFMAVELEDKISHLEFKNSEQSAILKSMVEGVIAIDMNHRILLINDAACRILSAEHCKASGKLIQETIRNTKIQEFITSIVKSRLSISDKKELQLNSEGHDIFVQIQGSPLQNAKGQTIGAVIVLHDITDIKKLENIRREFVANVSHELRTPLTSIKGFVETLVDEEQSSEDKTKFLNIIQKHVDRLNSIIEDLLTLATLEKEEKEDDFELSDSKADSIINNVKEICVQKAKTKNITVNSEISYDGTVRCSQPLIEQALLNLVDNAIKYSPEGSEVTIRCFNNTEGISLSVTDKGQGINQMHFEKIFERFYRIDKSRSRKEGGTGLGLSIVKHIMNLHKGKATVESEVGKGSVFTLVIPK